MKYPRICPKCRLLYGAVWKTCHRCNVKLVSTGLFTLLKFARNAAVVVLMFAVFLVFLYASQPEQRALYVRSVHELFEGDCKNAGKNFADAFKVNVIYEMALSAKIKLEKGLRKKKLPEPAAKAPKEPEKDIPTVPKPEFL